MVFLRSYFSNKLLFNYLDVDFFIIPLEMFPLGMIIRSKQSLSSVWMRLSYLICTVHKTIKTFNQ